MPASTTMANGPPPSPLPAGRSWGWRRIQELMTLVRPPAVQASAKDEEHFQQLAQSVNDVFWIYEPQSARFLYVSPAYEREWMRSAAGLYADPREWLGPVHRDDRPLLQEAFDHLARGDGYALEYRATTSSGQDRWIAETASPIARKTGQAMRIAGVSHDITAHKNVDLALLQSDRHKDEFLAMLAHELRNPLAPIRLAAALLARQHADRPAAEQKAISIIDRQVDHLTRLVDDLLDVVRIRHGKIRLRSEGVRIEEVIDAAVDANRELVEKNRLQLRVHLPGHDVRVPGDAVRLTQVFSNLLHNAAKFSVAGGTIEIGVHTLEVDKQVAVSVRDGGIGIAADLIDSVFDLFTQEDSLAHDRGGLGIGLSVVRSLVELHGGTVSVHSDGVGKGSEFVVILPTTDAATADVSVPIERRSGVGRRVLLVDDNRDAAETMQTLLELEGHTVALAFSGLAALDEAERLRPEVVIVDIGLPDISGHEVARRLKADTSLTPLLLVALTGYRREHIHQDAQEAAFDHHLVKPADPAMLMDLVWMSGARQPNETRRHSYDPRPA
jgi:PAS domain S-box-containing protein